MLNAVIIALCVAVGFLWWRVDDLIALDNSVIDSLTEYLEQIGRKE